jgi:hypothetical protein
MTLPNPFNFHLFIVDELCELFVFMVKKQAVKSWYLSFEEFP